MCFTAANHARAFLQRISNMLFHFCYRFFIDQRPDGDAFLQPVADVQFAHRLLQFFGKAVIHAVLHIQAVGADAGLPGVTEFRGQRAFHGFIEIGIVKDNKRCVAAQLQRHFFDVFRALFH